MGLDLGLRFKNLKNNETTDFGFAYWRKCYGIARYLVQKEKPKALVSDGDYELELPLKEIDFIIQELSNNLINRDSELWTDSIWSSCHTRALTCDELKNLIYLSEICEFFKTALPIKNNDDLKCLHQSLHVLFDHGCQSWEFTSSQWLYDTLRNISDYDVYIYIINSD